MRIFEKKCINILLMTSNEPILNFETTNLFSKTFFIRFECFQLRINRQKMKYNFLSKKKKIGFLIFFVST